MSARGDLTAAVVAWNGGEPLDRCLAALRANEVGDIVVVENGSAPAEQARVQARYGGESGVRIVTLNRNSGFAAGANVGMRAAMAGGVGLVLLVTQDVELEPGAVEIMSRVMSESPEAGIVGPLVLDSSRGLRELSRGERVCLPLICVPRTLLRYRRDHPDSYAVSGLMGCVLLLSRGCLEATGGFDEEFFAYYEEVDLCLRARRLGFGLLCAPRARARHDGLRGFMAGFSPASAELKARNLLRLMRKLGRAGDWALFAPTYLALIASSAALYAMRGRVDVAGAIFRGARAGVLGRSGAAAGAPGSAA